MVQPGEMVVVVGEGMRKSDEKAPKGDLYITLKVEMPDLDWVASQRNGVSGVASSLSCFRRKGLLVVCWPLRNQKPCPPFSPLSLTILAVLSATLFLYRQRWNYPTDLYLNRPNQSKSSPSSHLQAADSKSRTRSSAVRSGRTTTTATAKMEISLTLVTVVVKEQDTAARRGYRLLGERARRREVAVSSRRKGGGKEERKEALNRHISQGDDRNRTSYTRLCMHLYPI